jgi:hypothetical protein
MKKYVRMTDKFMSGWGEAEGKKNVLVFECDGWPEAFTVKENAINRGDMQYIKIYEEKPRYNPRTHLVQEKTKADYPKWYQEGAFSNGK